MWAPDSLLRQGCEAIATRFGVPREKLRVYLHYPPTFYHLHVHFTHVQV